MATQETKQLDEIISSRRAMMLMGGTALASIMLSGKAQAATVQASSRTRPRSSVAAA